MSIITLLVLQSGVVALVPAREADLRLDLAVRPRDCAADTSDDIVVCGTRRDDRYRLPRLDSARFEPKRDPKAELGIVGNVTGTAEVESATMPNGQVSNRLMLRLKLPF